MKVEQTEEQTSHEQLVGGVGIVSVGDLLITVAPLSQAEEVTLDRRLRKAAEEAAGDHYTRVKAALRSAEGADRVVMLKEVVRLASRKEPLSEEAFWQYRLSPPGVTVELFARGKKESPGLNEKELAAIITEFNVDGIADQLHTIIQAGRPKETR